MINFFANIFGYILDFIYEIVKNYGLAIILLSILFKLILLPLTIKQQKTMKKSQKVQKQMKEIQDKYKKSNPEKMNQEIMDLYKREKLSPFGGCLSSIIQIVLLIGMLYLVRSPLTYMKKLNKEEINNYKQQIVLEQGQNSVNTTYPELSIIKYINNKIDNKEKIVEEKNNVEQNTVEENNNKENVEPREDLYIDMEFLGLDLNSVPKDNYKDIKVFIIPVLYIISSFISIKMTQKLTQKEDDKKENIEKEDIEKENGEQENMTSQMNQSMTWMMPVLAVSVSLVAPLGLALYWLVNNILMIVERIFIDKIILHEEEENNG